MLFKSIGKLAYLLGFHDFRVIEVTAGFGSAGGVAKVECKRCHLIATRPN